MIKSLSTYNLITPFVSPLTGAICSKYTVNIYIWSGDKNTPPSGPEYIIEKENYEGSSGEDRIQIGRFVNDFVSFTAVNSAGIGLLNQTGLVWCKTEAIYTTTNPSDDGVAQNEIIQLVLKGYGYGNEGENPQPRVDGVLMESDLYRVSRNSKICVPLLLDANKVGTAISYPSNEIDYSFSELATDNSASILKLLNIPAPLADDYVEVDVAGRKITFIVKDEYKHSPVDVYFINKDGAQQTLTFFKQRKDVLTTEKETYENFGGQPSDGYHQFQDYNVNGRTGVTLTSGFVPESQNAIFKQLMLSTKVYIYNGEFIPVNVSSNSLAYQTRLNEKLISYDIEFKYSFAEINNI